MWGSRKRRTAVAAVFRVNFSSQHKRLQRTSFRTFLMSRWENWISAKIALTMALIKLFCAFWSTADGWKLRATRNKVLLTLNNYAWKPRLFDSRVTAACTTLASTIIDYTSVVAPRKLTFWALAMARTPNKNKTFASILSVNSSPLKNIIVPRYFLIQSRSLLNEN